MKNALRLNPEGSWQSPGFPFHHMVVEPEGNRVHISGQVAWDKNRNIISPGHAGAQTIYALESIGKLLAEIGGELGDVISVNIFYVNQADYADICAARKSTFSLSDAPASTAVRVTGLVMPELLVEISAIAVVPNDRFSR